MRALGVLTYEKLCVDVVEYSVVLQNLNPIGGP
jgi:hypothetical protein